MVACTNITKSVLHGLLQIKQYCFIDHSHIVLIIGDLNGLGHLPEFADQISIQGVNKHKYDHISWIDP